MNYKAVISDLDGTLLNSHHTISEYTKKIIKEVTNKGIKFFIATGRHHKDVEHIGRKLDLDTILISSNGSKVHDSNLEELFSHDIDENTVKDILKIEIDKEVHVNIYQGDSWFVERENEWIKEYHIESGFEYEVVNIKELKDYTASKIFFTCEDHNKLLKIKEELDEIFSENLNITFSTLTCLEVMACGVSKGMAIKKVLDKHSIKLEETIAFGDGLNDLEMLSSVGRGLVMGNALDKLKEALPENEVISTNNEDAVAVYLAENLLKNTQ
ncbi:Cof-type HAD-IIB family hydrolase [Anaeromicrobium sediminis]|uniref:Haloacid dehalogenase n=1 Tax=Anaeromicrobium sediminis TaxID=1478221 RepID=A0A267MJR5_9FIRM|nr:Cof-type HAD-IIB family hydrolase [Anaeromicrobium sediminis]PAB59158.1 hypothetical protein CCE28_11610 [Anaeromicrobium sediminis]